MYNEIIKTKETKSLTKKNGEKIPFKLTKTFMDSFLIEENAYLKTHMGLIENYHIFLDITSCLKKLIYCSYIWVISTDS